MKSFFTIAKVNVGLIEAFTVELVKNLLAEWNIFINMDQELVWKQVKGKTV